MRPLSLLAALLASASSLLAAETIEVRGSVVDAATGAPLPCRIYFQTQEGGWYFARSASAEGSAVPYDHSSQRLFTGSNVEEKHTTLSAHPFVVDLPPGKCTVAVERGKEYLPLTQTIDIKADLPPLKLALTRWVNMAERGWWSGETHVHRTPAELPNLQLAEDLNVALPLTQWTSKLDKAPTEGKHNIVGDFTAEPQRIDDTHYWYGRNTEYEYFEPGLGAFLILNHKTPFDLKGLPLGPVAEKIKAEGALVDLEKHVWPWSFVLMPIFPVHLYELGNNHLWRAGFAPNTFGRPAPKWMGYQGNGASSEGDWVDYGMKTYYALLNCGFRLMPTAGTASGVHAVPLGSSRVYVQLEGKFTYDAWMQGLAAGRSFVTTGPMVFAKTNGHLPGHTFSQAEAGIFLVDFEVMAANPHLRVEVVHNGDVILATTVSYPPGERVPLTERFQWKVPMESSGWIAVRCYEKQEDGRLHFAHTAPWFVEIPGKPLLPKREPTEWFKQCVEQEVARVRELKDFPPEALKEYEKSLEAWKKIVERAE